MRGNTRETMMLAAGLIAIVYILSLLVPMPAKVWILMMFSVISVASAPMVSGTVGSYIRMVSGPENVQSVEKPGYALSGNRVSRQTDLWSSITDFSHLASGVHAFVSGVGEIALAAMLEQDTASFFTPYRKTALPPCCERPWRYPWPASARGYTAPARD